MSGIGTVPEHYQIIPKYPEDSKLSLKIDYLILLSLTDNKQNLKPYPGDAAFSDQVERADHAVLRTKILD